jgi:membrane protein
MIQEAMHAASQWLRRVLTRPLDELDRWQKAVRFAYDLGRYGAQQLRQDRASQMAAALTFHTLFGLLPVLVVATVLVQAMGNMNDWFLQPLGKLLNSVGLDQVKVVSQEGTSISLSVWLQELVRGAERIDWATIRWVGLAVTIYAAVGLMVTIENSFNTIYRAPQGRPWTRGLPLYWFILTLSPAAVALSTYVNGRVTQFLHSIEASGWVSVAAGTLWSVLAVWLFMFLVYVLFPNTTVAVRPALVGALVAAVLLEIGKRTMGAYLNNALSISQLYGSLGLIPLFMYWVYLMWLVVLFGLEVSATLQMLHGRQLEEVQTIKRELKMIDPASVLSVMEVVAEHFQAARPATPRELAEMTSIPEHVVAQMLERLVDAGFLHRLASEDRAVSLARPPESVTADQLIAIGFGMVAPSGAGRTSALSEKLREVQTKVAAEYTLASAAGCRNAGS